ncbi:MAG TPA: SMC family ATPase [Glaciibacter sp.]|nr:SMC family ATPase [Glaciibacter sp.]
MRIRRLAIAGFGPYKSEQWIDFDAFRDDGLFLITGKTGAGKSSILDAICYALYGSIPRFDGAQPKLRSDHCTPDDPTYVELEFSVHDVDYLVRRVPDYERVKKNGTGTTTNKGTAELSRLVDGDWQAFAVGPRVVAAELDGILSLTKDQFLQVILLAQNRFQEFLLAKNDERQEVLRSLFGTSRFEQIEAELVQRHKALKDQLEAGRQGIAQQALVAASLAHVDTDDVPTQPELFWFEAVLVTVDAEWAAALAAAEEADEAFIAVETLHRAQVELQKRQLRRDAAVRKSDELATERPAIDADRRTLAAARRAAAVRPHVTARREAAESCETAVAAEVEARRAFESYSEIATTITREALDSMIDDVTRMLGTLDGVLAEERRLPALDATITSLEEAVSGCDADIAEVSSRVDAMPLQIDGVTVQLAEATVRAAGEAEARARMDRIMAARDAVAAAADLEAEYADALAAETAASGDNAAAATRVHQLMELRLHGHAAELAGTLIEGDPCAVCGSLVHPAPAVGTAEPVTQDDIDAARAVAEGCATAFATASAVVRDIANRLTEARTAAGGRTAGDLDAELAGTRTAYDEATTAAASIPTLHSQLAGLRSELANSQSTLSRLRADRDDAVQQLVAEQSTRTGIVERVEKHRGEYDTVSRRVEALTEHRESAVRVTDAITRTGHRREALNLAVEQLAAQLVGHDFADESEAVAAERSAAELIGWEERIRTHEHNCAITESTLRDPELVDLPTEPADVDAITDALDGARHARDATLTTASSAAERRKQLGRIVAAVRKLHAASGDLQQQYAQLSELASAVQGKEPNTKRMRLETYVLAAQLEEIVAAANTRLRIMTSGRYALQHDDSVQYRNTQSGLGLAILDEHTGRARATQSLSGGETFLASLALALGLAEVVTNQAGGITLDTLFIDEGFGSLDSQTLEIAMGTLDGLRAGGRTIGLISHVDAMKEQIPAKLRITVSPHGYSVIEPSFELV